MNPALYDAIFRFLFRILRKIFAYHLIFLVILIGLCFVIPPLIVVTVIYGGMVVVVWYFRENVMDFTYDFYTSGHWRDDVRGHFRLRTDDDPPPDFSKLRLLAWLFMGLPAVLSLLVIILFWTSAITTDLELRKTIVATIGYSFFVFLHVFFGYWALRGAAFVEKYQPLR